MQITSPLMAFITGGASGIGLGFARALAERGASIAIADIRADHLKEARAVARQEGWEDRAIFLPLDVMDRPGFAAALDAAEAALGPLRIMANNAGVGISGPMDLASYADWDWGLGVNLGGVVNGLVNALPRIEAHGLGGHVINTASLGALIPARLERGIYVTAKAGIIGLSEHLRLDLAEKSIGVSVLCPGPVKTNIRESGLTRPAHLPASESFGAIETALAGRSDAPDWLEPIDVGRMMVEAIEQDRLYIFPHPAFVPAVAKRHAAIEAAFGLPCTGETPA